jgi:prolyl oligopeptidase PreP (S9A serine peptidase family)
MKVILSVNNVPIRLTEERWLHITEEHSEMAGYYYDAIETISSPEAVYAGKSGECIALKTLSTDKSIVVIYKEVSSEDGFVITAFITSKKNQFERRVKLWPL